MQFNINNMNSQGEIKKLIREFREDDLYIAVPATILGIEEYETLQVVTVKPSIDLIYPDYDDAELTANTLKKVFVKLPSSGGFSVTMPVSVGDLCTLHWSHSDLNAFLDGNGSDVSQSKNHIAGIEDCWVELGFGTRKNNQSPSATNMVIKSDKTNITITPLGEITIETEGTSTLKSKLHTTDTDSITTGNATTNGNHTVGGNTIMGGTLAVTGATSVTGSSTVSGATTLNGVTTMVGAATAQGNLDFLTLSNAGTPGVTGVFASTLGSITIQNGIITNIA